MNRAVDTITQALLGSVLLAGAVATFALWPKPKERTATTKPRGISADAVSPMVGAGTLGAGLLGHF